LIRENLDLRAGDQRSRGGLENRVTDWPGSTPAARSNALPWRVAA